METMNLEEFRKAQGLPVKQPAIKPGVSKVSAAKQAERSSVKPTKPRAIKARGRPRHVAGEMNKTEQAFAEELEHNLTDEQLYGDDGVTARNAEEPAGSNICHTHDFCDANQVMLDACEKLGFDYSPNTNEKHDKLVQDAWDIASSCEFHDESIRVYFDR